MTSESLPTDGLVIFAKRHCETCAMVERVFEELVRSTLPTVVLTQDDPSFPSLVEALDDTALEQSFRFGVEAVPTVIRFENGKEVARTFGWNRAEWERLVGRPPFMPIFQVGRWPVTASFWYLAMSSVLIPAKKL